MAGFAEFRCSECDFKLRERYCLRATLPDGRPGYRDVMYCPDCREFQTILHEDPRIVDPELSDLRQGNAGRILDELLKGELSLDPKAPREKWIPGIPRPSKLLAASRRLIATGLVIAGESALSLTPEGRKRLERDESMGGPRNCPVCRRELTENGLGASCPSCGKGLLGLESIGRCSDTCE